MMLGMWITIMFAGMAQLPVSLDSCRNMAIRNNKTLQIANEKVRSAGYARKTAFSAYLPGIDFTGSYMYNQKNVSLTGANMNIPEIDFGKLGPVGQLIQGPLNELLDKFDDYKIMEFDIHNVFAGAVTLTQPIYMGGKIKAMNDITRYAEELAESQKSTAVKDIVFATDEAYWQVISLVHKKDLAESYAALLDSLNRNVQIMIDEGVATKSDGLTVAVKLNEAQIAVTKVNNGLTLSRMLLAQICGLPVNTVMTLEDETFRDEVTGPVHLDFNMDDVYANRSEIRSLTLATKIFDKKKTVATADMLPKLALVGNYIFSNPSSFNGFKNEFGGMFNVGVMLNIPILHWGGNYNKIRAAKSEALIARLELEDAKEKIELQVNQASFKASESVKQYEMTCKNMEKAEENLRNAQIGFQEGVLTTNNVLEAQTAWLQANSEKIDAGIDVSLCEVYLAKALGRMKY